MGNDRDLVLHSRTGIIRICFAVLAAVSWMVVSSLLILLNKYLMVDLGFRYPMFVAGTGMVMSGLLSYVVCVCLRLVEAKNTITLTFWVHKVMPVGFFMAMTLWTGNVVYMHLSVAFIQMLKAFTPVITMLCLYLARLEDPTGPMIASVFIIAAGVVVAAYGEINLSFVGLAIMLASETSEAIRLVMTQYLLVGLRFHPIEGLLYLAPACAMYLAVGSAILEWPVISRSGAIHIVKDHPWLFLLAAVMGFCVNVLAYTTIKLTSAITLKVLGTMKNAILVTWSVLVLREVVTPVQTVGYCISLAGFGWYNSTIAAKVAAGQPPLAKAASVEAPEQDPELQPLKSGTAGQGYRD
ncbi:MAG: hypothetical protein WDW38_002951 [Sanguina aurantia]